MDEGGGGGKFLPGSKSIPRGSLTKTRWARAKFVNEGGGGAASHERRDKYVVNSRKSEVRVGNNDVGRGGERGEWFPAEPPETNLIRCNYADCGSLPGSDKQRGSFFRFFSLSLSFSRARFLSFLSVGNVEREGSFRYVRNLVTLPQG